MATTPVTLPTNKGLLAFIWDIYTNNTKATSFKTDPVAMMNQYELSVDQQRAIWAAGLDRNATANDTAWATLATGSTLPTGSTSPPLVDVEWANPDGMALLAQMIVDVLAGKPQWKNAW